MNIQTTFIYCMLTILVIYCLLHLDYKYFPKDSKEERVLRHSVLCGLIIWVIIVYFIYKSEVETTGFAQSQQTILNDNF
jgi:heme/copper-type cytochrome/quinol oxidase subunit 4